MRFAHPPDRRRAGDLLQYRWRDLAELRAEEPLTTGELARRMHIEVPTAVRMTQRMEATGLLRRRSDPADRRRVLVTLTEAGRRAAEEVPLLLDAVSEQALTGLSHAERETLTGLLQRVSANLDWPPSRHSQGARTGS